MIEKEIDNLPLAEKFATLDWRSTRVYGLRHGDSGASLLFLWEIRDYPLDGEKTLVRQGIHIIAFMSDCVDPTKWRDLTSDVEIRDYPKQTRIDQVANKIIQAMQAG